MLKSTSSSAAPTAVITTRATTTLPAPDAINNYWIGTTITLVPYVLISAIGVLLVVLFHLVRNQQQLSQPKKHQRRQRAQSKARVPQGQVNRELESKLLLLLNHERGTAERLVHLAMQHKPGQTERWYL